MNIRLCRAMLAMFLFSGICFAQVPQPPIPAPSLSDISLGFIFAGKQPSHYGVGGQFTASRFVNDRLGFQVEGDYLRTDEFNLRDAGVRVGPVVRFGAKHAVQPYLHALLGYAEVKSSYLKPVTSFNGAPSVLAGGGIDFRLSGGWHGIVEGDIEEDWAANRTRNARGVVGVSYRFGARQKR